MAIKNTKKVVSKTTTRKAVVTTTTKKSSSSSSDLKPGEVRVPSRYKPFSQQNYSPENIVPMEPADTASFSKPGYRVDLSRSKKIKDGNAFQETYIKLAPNSAAKKTVTKKTTTAPNKSEDVKVGTLPIRKATTIETTRKEELVKRPKSTITVPVEVKRPSKVSGRLKITGKKAGASFNKRATKNVGTTVLAGRVRGAVQNAKFNREEKLAGGYERVGKAVEQRGASMKENVKDIKEYKKYVKSAEGKKTLGKEAKSIKKDLNLSKRYLKREDKGKNKYFNKEALNKTQEMTLSELKKSKGKTQAGRTRYSS